MKHNYLKSIVVAWSFASLSWSIAQEDDSLQEATPPPAVPSSYFASSSSAPETPKNSESASNSGAGSGVTNARVSNISTQEQSKAPVSVTPAVSAQSPVPPLPDPSQAAQSSGNLNQLQPQQGSTGGTETPGNITVTPDNNDASTGIQGAHITKGINFEPPAEDLVSIGGVDTTHVKHSSGNWVEKKHYWHEIEEIVDQAKEKIADIGSQRTTFFTTRSEIDKELNTFYQHVGLDQGPLQDMIHYALEIMEKEKEKQGFLNKKERTFYEKIQAKQRVFEQLKEDVKAIGVIDTKLDEALDVVLKQLNACNEYEGEVWTIYKTVAYELSEKEAEQHYFIAKAFLKDIENIQMYFSGPLKTYFQELAESIQSHTQNIVMQLDSLEQEGLDLRKEAAIFETEELKAAGEQQIHKEELKAREEKSSKQQSGVVSHTQKTSPAQKPAHLSITTRIGNFFGYIKDTTMSFIGRIVNLFRWSHNNTAAPVAKKVSNQIHTQEHAAATDRNDAQSQNSMSEKDKKPSQFAIEKSELREEVKYDEHRFAQEMEELKKSIEAGAQEVIAAPGDLFHSLEHKL